MKRLCLAIFLISLCLSSQVVFAYTENWEITDFNQEIQLNEDRSATITETISADFTNEEHRGLLRQIPYDFKNGSYQSRSTKIDLQETSDPWEIVTYKENGYFNIEMWTPEKIYTNKKESFQLKYRIDNIINSFDEHDEFYWNINGTDWVVPTKNASATITLPQEIPEENLKIDCFTGIYGATEKNCQWEIVDQKTIKIHTTKQLAPYQGLSIVIATPKGIFAEIPFWTMILGIFLIFWPILLPLITILIMYRLWSTKGRDDQSVNSTLVPRYTPPEGLTPTETGTIIDEKLDPKDITATIIDYAVKDFIRINETEKKNFLGKSYKYELELLKPYHTSKEFEELTLKGIFPNNIKGEKRELDDLKNKFYKEIPAIRKSIMNQLIKDDFFPHNPQTIRLTYAGTGGAIAFICINFLIVFSPLGAICGAISGGIVAIWGLKMPRKTTKGTQAYHHLRGLYEYINTAEKDRLKFQEDANIMFEKLLPYAMAFGIAKKWAGAFEGLIKTPPSWYNSNRAWDHGFNMVYFSRCMDSLGRDLTTGIVSRPGSKGGGAWSGGSGFGGGGFSGGGFGGGGGRGL
ncbi:DUF2207 domain-containing protein [Patescibacteria group bacterium]|nr:DUF2207 domain-containing protein [Patescibacteria group bacterium]